MKVLVLAHMYPRSEFDSTGIFVKDQAKHLQELGCEVIIVSPLPWMPSFISSLRTRWRQYREVPARSWLDNIEVYHPRYLNAPGAWFFPFRAISMLIGSLGPISKIHKRWHFDLIHAHTVLPDGLVALIGQKIWKVPVLCTAHGSDINIYPHLDRLTYYLSSLVISKVDLLIAVSQALSTKIRTIAEPRRMHVLYNGADHRLFHPINKVEARKQLGIPDSPVIMFVGNLIECKGAHLLVPLMKEILLQVSDAELYILGDGVLKEKIRQAAARSGIADQIHLVGRHPHSEIPVWLNAADVLIMPSLSEGFPTLISETLACGRPVVATRVGGIPEALSEDVGVLVEPGNIALFSRAVIQSLQRTWNLDHILAKSRNLTWESNAAKHIEIYAQLNNRD